MNDSSVILHATCVSIAGRGVLIMGPSGSGKSSLALQLIALGAALISDDRTVVRFEDSTLIAAPPAAIAGMIEARGVGIISVPHLDGALLVLTIDMGCTETDRLPEAHVAHVLDVTLPCLRKVDAPYFSAAIYAYVLGMRKEAI
tara:strand:+ start:248 stop:679 length:432 start_codon:yes stop_codon:yes gene_type:complete